MITLCRPLTHLPILYVKSETCYLCLWSSSHGHRYSQLLQLKANCVKTTDMALRFHKRLSKPYDWRNFLFTHLSVFWLPVAIFYFLVQLWLGFTFVLPLLYTCFYLQTFLHQKKFSVNVETKVNGPISLRKVTLYNYIGLSYSFLFISLLPLPQVTSLDLIKRLVIQKLKT